MLLSSAVPRHAVGPAKQRSLMKLPSWARGLMLAGALLIVWSPASAQQTESRVSGRVVDTTGAVLPGVTVTVTSTQTGATRQALTAADGAYLVTNLQPGSYVVSFQLDGFQRAEQNATLGVADTRTVSATMSLAGMTEQVTVQADVRMLDAGIGEDWRQRVARSRSRTCR